MQEDQNTTRSGNEKHFANVRPGRSLMVFKIRLLLNRVRSCLYFRLRAPWVKRSGMTRIPWNVDLCSPHRDIEIGDRVQFGKGCVVQCDAKFGDNVLMARDVAFVGLDDHRYDIIGKAIWDSPRGDTRKSVVEDDVWIGHGAIIIAGVNIGRGAIVAAGSVVNRDVEPYAIVAGTPARVVAQRFTEDEIRRHEKILGYSTRISVKTKD